MIHQKTGLIKTRKYHVIYSREHRRHFIHFSPLNTPVGTLHTDNTRITGKLICKIPLYLLLTTNTKCFFYNISLILSFRVYSHPKLYSYSLTREGKFNFLIIHQLWCHGCCFAYLTFAEQVHLLHISYVSSKVSYNNDNNSYQTSNVP
jgi:hypothetical protein